MIIEEEDIMAALDRTETTSIEIWTIPKLPKSSKTELLLIMEIYKVDRLLLFS